MINFKSITDCTHNTISNSVDVRELYESMRSIQNQDEQSQKIFIWSGFGKNISTDLFQKRNWPQNFVRLFGNQEMWPWKFKSAKDESDRLGNQDLIKALKFSSQDIIASLRIRGFDSDDPFQGSVEWLEEIIPYLNDECPESNIFIRQIIQSLSVAKKAGINLFLEKISLIICCDPQNPITLTPHLHRDGAYGHLESSIVSFYSERTTTHSSTLFFPDFDFEAAASLKPITAEILNKHFSNKTAYSLTSGSLAIFSGKLASDGSKSDTRGALHMSPEGFFSTRRLVLLFRSKIS